MTSHDVVAAVRRTLRQGGRTPPGGPGRAEPRVGHGGTLDPLAAGVLPVAVGSATRLVEYVMGGTKRYRAEVVLGVSTTSCDADGEVVAAGPPRGLEAEAVARALGAFRGRILQVPPMASAVRHQGKQLYRLAREGKTVPRRPRAVTIYRLELVGWWVPGVEDGVAWPGYPRALLDVECSKGTYVRALAHDLGQTLGSGAHLGFLLRQRVGTFHLEDAATLEELEAAAGAGRLQARLVPAREAVGLPWFYLLPAGLEALGYGRELGPAEVAGWPRSGLPGGPLLLLAPDGRLAGVGIGDPGGTVIRPHKVFFAGARLARDRVEESEDS